MSRSHGPLSPGEDGTAGEPIPRRVRKTLSDNTMEAIAPTGTADALESLQASGISRSQERREDGTMKGLGWRVGAVGVAVGMAGCVLPISVVIDDDWTRIHGNGHVVSEWRSLPPFDAVSASGPVRVIVERTGREEVTITAEENLQPHLRAEVRGGTLYVGSAPGVGLAPRRDVVFRVESVEVVELRGSGAASMEVDVGALDRLWVTLDGASQLAAWGVVDRQDVSVSGASRYDALDLDNLHAVLDLSGASEALVWVRDRLDVDASGASSVRFRGAPAVNARVSGASWVARY